MQRGCPLNEEGHTCHVQLQELFTRTWLAFKEIGGMKSESLQSFSARNRIISANGSRLLLELQLI